MAFEIRDNPDFSWSSSRSRLFEECQLCYGLHYYGAHNGWLKQADTLAQAAYRYKVTRSTEERLMEAVVKLAYDHHYKTPIEQEAMRQEVKKALNVSFVASQKYKADWYARPKHVPILTEMIEQDALPGGFIQDVSKKMNAIVDNFYTMKTEDEVKDGEIIHLSRFNKFTMARLDSLTVFVNIHLLYRRQDGKMVAVNFKTTDEESHIDQLGSTALYLMHKYRLDLSDIVIRDEFLLSGTHREVQLCDDDIEEMYDVIEDSVNMMAECVVDGDLNHNEGLPLENFLRNPNHSDSCGVVNCPYCQLVKQDIEKYPNGIKSYAV